MMRLKDIKDALPPADRCKWCPAYKKSSYDLEYDLPAGRILRVTVRNDGNGVWVYGILGSRCVFTHTVSWDSWFNHTRQGLLIKDLPLIIMINQQIAAYTAAG